MTDKNWTNEEIEAFVEKTENRAILGLHETSEALSIIKHLQGKFEGFDKKLKKAAMASYEKHKAGIKAGKED